MKKLTKLSIWIGLAFALPAVAAEYKAVGLGFENMQVLANGVYGPAQVWQFYDGGYSRSENGEIDLVLGPDNYAVPFNSSALALRSTNAGGDGNFGPRFLGEQGGTPLTGVGVSALYFLDSSPVLNYSQGFGLAFSFYYASSGGIEVTLYDGLDGSGAVVGSGIFAKTELCTLEDNAYCAWALGAVQVAGTARSVRLGGLDNQTLYDNVTFGSLTPIDGVIPVPEPSSSALLLLGLAGLGLAARRRAVRA